MASIPAPILTVHGLRIGIQRGKCAVPVVDSVSFSLGRGEMLAILGESGCGKSLTALALMGLLPEVACVLSGQVCYDGRDMLAMPPGELRRLRGGALAMIFQEPMTALNPVMSVGEQLLEALELHGAPGESRAQRLRRAAELLAEVEIPNPEARLAAYPHELSGGLRQRVMIAMALAGNPQVLIADEPTTALDVTVQAQIMALLARLRRKRAMSVIFITHNLALAAGYSGRCVVMYAGEVVESASSLELFRHPAHPYTRMLFQALPSLDSHGAALATIPGMVPKDIAAIVGCRFAERCPQATAACRRAPVPLTALSEDHECRCGMTCAITDAEAQNMDSRSAAPASGAGASDVVLEAQNLSMWFPLRGASSGGWFHRREKQWLKAVDGVSLVLRRGETLALVGESGCGKSTAGKCLIRLLEPTDGHILLPDGTDVARLSGGALLPLRRMVQMIFQDPFSSLDPRLMIGESIAEGCALRGVTGSAAAERVSELLQQVGLRPEDRLRYPHQFSGGQRQRIGLARALAAEPSAIICDECTSALDVSVQAQILNLLKDIQQRTGVAYLFITHDLSVVAHLADRIAVMKSGRIIEEGRAEDILRHPADSYTQALLDAAPSTKEMLHDIHAD